MAKRTPGGQNIVTPIQVNPQGINLGNVMQLLQREAALNAKSSGGIKSSDINMLFPSEKYKSFGGTPLQSSQLSSVYNTAVDERNNAERAAKAALMGGDSEAYAGHMKSYQEAGLKMSYAESISSSVDKYGEDVAKFGDLKASGKDVVLFGKVPQWVDDNSGGHFMTREDYSSISNQKALTGDPDVFYSPDEVDMSNNNDLRTVLREMNTEIKANVKWTNVSRYERDEFDQDLFSIGDSQYSRLKGEYSTGSKVAGISDRYSAFLARINDNSSNMKAEFDASLFGAINDKKTIVKRDEHMSIINKDGAAVRVNLRKEFMEASSLYAKAEKETDEATRNELNISAGEKMAIVNDQYAKHLFNSSISSIAPSSSNINEIPIDPFADLNTEEYDLWLRATGSHPSAVPVDMQQYDLLVEEVSSDPEKQKKIDTEYNKLSAANDGFASSYNDYLRAIAKEEGKSVSDVDNWLTKLSYIVDQADYDVTQFTNELYDETMLAIDGSRLSDVPDDEKEKKRKDIIASNFDWSKFSDNIVGGKRSSTPLPTQKKWQLQQPTQLAGSTVYVNGTKNILKEDAIIVGRPSVTAGVLYNDPMTGKGLFSGTVEDKYILVGEDELEDYNVNIPVIKDGASIYEERTLGGDSGFDQRTSAALAIGVKKIEDKDKWKKKFYGELGSNLEENNKLENILSTMSEEDDWYIIKVQTNLAEVEGFYGNISKLNKYEKILDESDVSKKYNALLQIK